MSEIFDNEDDVVDNLNLRAEGPSGGAGIERPSVPVPVGNVNIPPRPTIKVKERIAGATATSSGTIKIGDHELTPAEVIELSNRVEENLRSKAEAATTRIKPAIKELDYTKLTMDDVYDLSIPIEAKAFGANDPLKVDLKDKTYEARWVYKDPRRLGYMRACGFIYVNHDDLGAELEIEVIPDAESHFTLDDVVLMRIPKVKYYGMMRANHERSVNTMSSVGATKRAQMAAETYMSKNAGGEYASLAEQGKINFYKPGIEI
jgi:hypothetical protein